VRGDWDGHDWGVVEGVSMAHNTIVKRRFVIVFLVECGKKRFGGQSWPTGKVTKPRRITTVVFH